MNYETETPSSVLYSCMKQFGGVTNRNLAQMLFSETFTYGGSPLIDRLDERSFLSRSVVRATPGDFPEGAFHPFPQSAQALYSALASKYPGGAGKAKITEYFVGEACERMCESLRELELNEALYRNLVRRITEMKQIGPGDRAMLLILQFVATGALGNPSRAARITQDYASRAAQANFATDIVSEGTVPDEPQETPIQLGLCRIIDGKMRMPAYTLDAGPEGTEIGSLSTADHAINDVGAGVSRRHLRVFRDEAGRWFAQGLGSTNGSSIIRSGTGEQEPIELPRNQRGAQAGSPCVQIFANDVICLATTTQFSVIEFV